MSSITLKAHAQGSTEPKLEKGVIRLYGMRFCPFVYRVRLVLAAKNIPYETVNINLKNKPDWYLKKNPEGKVPLMEKDGHCMWESLIICDYLDEKYPEPKLWYQDPGKKALGRICIEIYSKCHGYLIKLIKLNDETAFEDCVRELKNLNKELAEFETDYFSGDTPGMADYMIWPFVEMIRAFFKSGHYKGNKDLSSMLKDVTAMRAWIKKMSEDPVVQKCTQGEENLTAYIVSMLNGNPDYDIGL